MVLAVRFSVRARWNRDRSRSKRGGQRVWRSRCEHGVVRHQGGGLLEDFPPNRSRLPIPIRIQISEDYSKIFLRTDLGFRYQYESRFQYYPTPMREPGVTLVAPRLGAVFRYAFSKGTIFSEEAEVLPNIAGDARVLINSQSKLTALLTGALSFAAGYGVKFDSAPAPGKVDTETTLTLGLEVAF